MTTLIYVHIDCKLYVGYIHDFISFCCLQPFLISYYDKYLSWCMNLSSEHLSPGVQTDTNFFNFKAREIPFKLEDFTVISKF